MTFLFIKEKGKNRAVKKMKNRTKILVFGIFFIISWFSLVYELLRISHNLLEGFQLVFRVVIVLILCIILYEAILEEFKKRDSKKN